MASTTATTVPTAAATNPYQHAMRNLLGQSLKCTLDDGRTATGTLICIDRLKNLILSQVVEERTVDSSVYSHDRDAPSSKISAKRLLAQAMIPGSHLVKVEIAQSTYDTYVQPVLVAAED